MRKSEAHIQKKKLFFFLLKKCKEFFTFPWTEHVQRSLPRGPGLLASPKKQHRLKLEFSFICVKVAEQVLKILPDLHLTL